MASDAEQNDNTFLNRRNSSHDSDSDEENSLTEDLIITYNNRPTSTCKRVQMQCLKWRKHAFLGVSIFVVLIILMVLSLLIIFLDLHICYRKSWSADKVFEYNIEVEGSPAAIYIGGAQSSRSAFHLHEQNIERVLSVLNVSEDTFFYRFTSGERAVLPCVKQNLSLYFIAPEYHHLDGKYHQFETMWIPARDKSAFNIERYFDLAVSFISTSMLESKSILVHCQSGISRSTTLVAAYLIHHFCWSPSKAIDYIHEHRHRVNPNHGFRDQLEHYYQHVLSKPHCK